jgi:uncharacterized protein (UPF0262 family)/protein-tyrosine-phosphatase
MGEKDFDEKTDHLVNVTLDPSTITSINYDEMHERKMAIFDLVEKNAFYPARVNVTGPFALHLSIMGNYLLFDIRNPDTYQPIVAHYLSLSPFRSLIRDYFRVREHYFEAIKSAQPFQIEAVDMGRRGLHNEAADFLIERLKNKIIMDHDSARRLFTLICAIQPYADRQSEKESGLPTVLFVCSMNSVRSPIAAALARRAFSNEIITRSAGVRSGKIDGFVSKVMEEIGVDMSVHTPHMMSELAASHFDLIITLSNEAKRAVKSSVLVGDRVEHWSVCDPTIYEGNREQKLEVYRELRGSLEKRILNSFTSFIKNGSQSA